ncbi:hypothetical protein SSCG_04200 [Streptomyces clavuligerus]|nr:hypothetical protein SSCG_04200 [Streptomyces clavuligerus]
MPVGTRPCPSAFTGVDRCSSVSVRVRTCPADRPTVAAVAA